MTIEIANRLVELRKKAGLSQEELAAKLGLSRQAVSKWERAEASPDTDNLICLAKIYGVSFDDLLKTDDDVKTIVDEQVKPNQEEKGKTIISDDGDIVRFNDNGMHITSSDGDEVNISSSGIHVESKDGEVVDLNGDNVFKNSSYSFHKENKKINLIEGIVLGSLALIITLVYLTLGFLFDNTWAYPLVWPVGWILYFVLPFAESIFSVIKRKTMGSFTGAVVALVLFTYFVFGFFFNAWHPAWALFLLIPIFGIISGPIDKAIKANRNNTNGNIVEDDDKDE